MAKGTYQVTDHQLKVSKIKTHYPQIANYTVERYLTLFCLWYMCIAMCNNAASTTDKDSGHNAAVATSSKKHNNYAQYTTV